MRFWSLEIQNTNVPLQAGLRKQWREEARGPPAKCDGLLIFTQSLSSLSGCRNSFTDILRAILLSLEVLIEDPELQINGFLLIIDWSNFSFKQASKLTPSILRLAIEGLQVCAVNGHHEAVGGKVPFSCRKVIFVF